MVSAANRWPTCSCWAQSCWSSSASLSSSRTRTTPTFFICTTPTQVTTTTTTSTLLPRTRHFSVQVNNQTIWYLSGNNNAFNIWRWQTLLYCNCCFHLNFASLITLVFNRVSIVRYIEPCAGVNAKSRSTNKGACLSGGHRPHAKRDSNKERDNEKRLSKEREMVKATTRMCREDKTHTLCFCLLEI